MPQTIPLPTPMNNAWYHKISDLLKLVVYGMFLILSLRIIVIYLSYVPANLRIAGVFAIFVLGLLTWWQSFWILNLFVAMIPFVVGIQLLAGEFPAFGLLKSAPILSIAFAIIYSSWFFKRGIYHPKNLTFGTMSDLAVTLSGIVIISLFMGLFIFPQEMMLKILFSAPIQGQNDSGWGTQASYILLQGLFFFCIMQAELKKREQWNGLWLIIIIQAVSIIIFSACQWVFNFPEKLFVNAGAFTPFHDIHSSGSYVLFLFFIFLSLWLSQTRYRIFSASLTIFFGFYLVQLGSKITWFAMLITALLLFMKRFKYKYNVVIISLITLAFILVNLFSDRILDREDTFRTRFQKAFVVSNYTEKTIDYSRLALWERAINIIKAYPLTGSGIGSYFKVSPYFHEEKNTAWDEYYENTHNYYLQLGADLGIPALLIFLLVLIRVCLNSVRSIKKNQTTHEAALVEGLFFGFIAFLITMFTGHPLILSSHQFLFWFMVLTLCSHMQKSIRKKIPNKMHSMAKASLISLLLISLGAGHAYTLTMRQTPITYDFGFYPYEDINKKRFRWTMKDAWLKMWPKGSKLNFDIYISPFSFNPKISKNDNLLVNGNFEGQSHRWRSDDDCKIFPIMSGKSGSGIAMEAISHTQKWVMQEGIQLTKGKFYQFSLWYKDGTRKGRKIRASMYDGRTEIWATYKNNTFLTTNGVWQRLVRTFQCPTSSDNWRLYIYWQDESEKGSVHFDDASLHELTFDIRKPLKVRVAIKDILVDERSFENEGFANLNYILPAGRKYPIEIFFSTEREFNPYDLGLSMDIARNRGQGIAVGPTNYLD